MNRMKCILAALMILLVPLGAGAQYEIPHGQVCAGSGSAGGSHFLRCTAGQYGIARTVGGAYEYRGGFWYMAWESSTVDVAVTSVFAEYTGDGIVVYWTVKADTPYDGFNIYRAEGVGGDFMRLNEEPVPPGEDLSYLDADVSPDRTYVYRIGAIEGGSEFMSSDLEVTLPPAALALYQNYPNPFNPSTSIKCYLPSMTAVTLEIFDVAGRRIAVLADREILKGFQLFEWDGRDASGDMTGSGVYFYRLTAGKEKISRKMVLLR